MSLSQLKLSWDSIFCDSAPFAQGTSRTKLPTRENLEMELALFKANCGRGRLLETCRNSLLAIPPSSVQPERDFSVVRQVIGETRSRLSFKTLNDIFILKKAFLHDVF